MPSTYQSIVVEATIDQVWQKLSNFHDMSWAPDVVVSCEAVGDIGGTKVGAKRILNDAFHETVTRVEQNKYVFEYSIDDGPSPVSPDDVKNYIGSIKLRPVTEGVEGEACTFVEWSSSWESDKDEAVEFCHGIYVALLNALKANI